MVVKIPDGSFSRGVHKVETVAELKTLSDRLFEDTDLLLAQKFMPTKFDWRVGVLDGEPLFVCQYQMARGHWQIIKHGPNGAREGGSKTLAIADAPPRVIDIGLKAARAVGPGLYGVDIKETDGSIVVIEVNDNPNLEHGVEDLVGKDEIWARILQLVHQADRRLRRPDGADRRKNRQARSFTQSGAPASRLETADGGDLMNPNKALWEKGDFTRIAASMRESGEELVGKLGVTKGMKVLDLGCGDGTTALPEARLGADVLGVDIAANLVEAGNRRAKEAGLTNCRFQEGDAASLGDLDDASFDLVVSIFGAMFAPKPFDVAREMARVTRPGGRIVMGNWIPNDPTLVAQILKISSAYSPPPPEGFVSPMTWGVESQVIERFGAARVPADRIAFVREAYTFRFPSPASELVDAFRKYYGPTMNAFEAAEKNGRAGDLKRELDNLFNSHNQSRDADATLIPATYLRVTVSR